MLVLKSTEDRKYQNKELTQVFEQDRVTVLNGAFQGSDVIGIGKLYDVQFVVSLHIFHPLVYLALWVDHQRPPPRVLRDYSLKSGLNSK